VRVACILALLGALVAPLAAGADVSPRVRVVSSTATTFVVRGSSFEARERLLIRLVGSGITAKRVVSDQAGSFRVSLIKPEPLACGRYFLTVRRAGRKSVVLRLGPSECAQPAVGNVAARSARVIRPAAASA
jgi:hypothetical protein